ITIVWANSGGTGVAGYKIYRNGTSVQTIPSAGTLTYADGTDLAASTQYCYRVSATDAVGKESAQSSTSLCATTYAIPPADPAGLIVRPVSPTQVDLAWTASAGAAQYKIYRNGALLATMVSTSYTDAVAADTQYVYLVTAIDSTGSESSGATSNAAVNTALTVPSGVTATVNSSTQITLSWTNSGGSAVTGYKVYKNDTLLGAVAPATTTSIVEGELTPNTQYCYSVSSTDSFTNESAKSITVCGTTDAPPAPNSVDLLVSSPQLNSDGASPVTLTALVKDSQNRAMEGQTVDFSATSGMLTDLKSVTDANGMATAKLGAGGDPTDRTITLTALTGGKTATNAVAVTGTNISIDPPAFSLPFNDPIGKQLTISLKDSAGGAIAGKTVSVASSTGKSSFTPASTYTTDSSGQVKVTVKNATDTGSDTITASAIGVSSQATLTINNAKLTVKTDTLKANAEVPINTAQPFTVTYTEGGTAVAGKTVYFTATRGTLSASSVNTNASGEATANVSSVNAGPTVLSAYTTGDPQASAQVAIIFVATTADKIDLSAFPAIINTNAAGQAGEQSLIKAIVRDDKDNLVKGKTVNFTIIQDASGGTLSKGSAVTDMYGTATTNYIAGGNAGGLNNVQITATVQDTPAVNQTTTLTVGGQSLFISLATGPTIAKLEPNMYRKDYLALVTDAGGRPVANAVVTATVTPQYYMKGHYYVYGDGWLQMKTLSANLSTSPVIPACANEDGLGQGATAYYNGVLDDGEDQNANSRLDPGNVASVTAAVTDSSGHSTISLTYARDYAFWVNVKLEARASLGGSTASAVQTFDLQGAAADYADKKVTPPGNPSPFGDNATCYVSLTALALSDTKISLHWEPSAYAASYNIWRDPNDGSAAVKIVSLVPTSYEDTVAAGKTYCYEIKQVDSAGLETPLAAAGNRVCASSAATSPTGVTAVALSPIQIQVSWGDAGAAGYRIYKDGVYLQDSVARTIVSGNLTANTQYCYAVSSLNEVGSESAQSATVCATTQPSVPDTPTGLTATGGLLAAGPPATYKVDLTWTNNGAALYRIYRDGALRLSATGTPAVDSDVVTQTGYCYTISAVDALGNESLQSTPQCTATP
ncbi:MAG: Ig-like domain-containing protein, partial [Syntrophales bacterium]